MSLSLKPTGIESVVGNASWFKLPPSPGSGYLSAASSTIGRLMNPREGGVYHIGAAFDGSPTNECNIVLPLAGASVDSILAADLGRADEFARKACNKYSLLRRNTPWFGYEWFVKGGNGDYIGRPDSSSKPTVWVYNQVNDDSGMGAVGTLAGVPIRVAKLSNLVAGYMCEKFGVIEVSQDLSQLIGSLNGDSASASWDCGKAIAKGANFTEAITTFAEDAWYENDDKANKLWPNPSSADNHSSDVDYTDVNRLFYSPGMLYKEP